MDRIQQLIEKTRHHGEGLSYHGSTRQLIRQAAEALHASRYRRRYNDRIGAVKRQEQAAEKRRLALEVSRGKQLNNILYLTW